MVAGVLECLELSADESGLGPEVIVAVVGACVGVPLVNCGVLVVAAVPGYEPGTPVASPGFGIDWAAPMLQAASTNMGVFATYKVSWGRPVTA